MMKLVFSTLILYAGISSVSAIPLSLSRRGVDPSLVPQFGHAAGLNPTGTGDCDGIPNAQGVPIKIPCGCPPDRDSFIASLSANVAAGQVITNPTVKLTFPTDDSKSSQLARINAAAVTLQNLHGPGVGCPIVSTTFSAQAQAIQNDSVPPPATASTAPPATTASATIDCAPDVTIVVTKTVTEPAISSTPAPPSASTGIDPNLVPQFGLAAGLNPTGTGDCDGIPNAQGVPIKIPCICPPDRASFIQSLSANVAAGHVINNPSIKLSSFPTDNSKDSQLARLNVAAVTLQNLRGPGVGCPIVSTTFSAQAQAIQNGDPPPPSATITSTATKKAAAPVTTQSTAISTPTSTAASIDPNLVPQFGLASGLNPTSTGDCDGIPNAQGIPIKIPCICPPDRESFIKSLSANVAAGHAINNPGAKISFPTDDSKDSQLARINAASITLQNLRGPGVGCPIVSTTFSAQAQAIQNGSATPPPVPTSASTLQAPNTSKSVTSSVAKPVSTTASTPSSTSTANGVDPNLVPQFGHAAGLNPTGTGDCDGIPNAQGVPIKIPCACPPDRSSFIQSLSANVAAGHAVNNPSVKVTFPTDDSKASKLARFTAAAITLQNLHGPGIGCPIVSTTFQAQSQAIQNAP